MQKKLTAILRYAFLLVIGMMLLWLAFRGIDVRSTLNEFRNIDYGWLGVSILVSVIAFFSRARRWNLLIHPLGYRPLLTDTSNALMVGYLANLAVPRLGEVTRCGSLNRTSKVPFEMLIGTVIVERVLDVICLGSCLILTAWMEYDLLGDFLITNIFNPLQQKFSGWLSIKVIVTTTVILATIIFLMVKKSKTRTNDGKPSKIKSMISGILHGLRSARKVDRKAEFFFHTVFIWFLYFLMSYTCFKALPATAELNWEAGLFVLVVGGMGMSAPVQGGIGAYHLLVSRGLLLYGMTTVHGLAFATLMHTSQTLLVIFMGSISMILVSLKAAKSTGHGNN